MRTNYLFPFRTRYLGIALIILHIPIKLLWDKLYPAFQAEALPVDATGQEKLRQEIANLEAHPAKKG